MEKKSLLPPIQWAQRKDKLFVTINIRDIANEKIDLKEEMISFSGSSDNQNYQAEIHLYQEVDPQESKWTKVGLNLQIILMKKNKTESFWPRLTKDDKKSQNISIDWNRYVDEDEEDEEGNKEAAGPGWDPSQMNQFQQPGYGDEEEEEDEEGNLDDLDQDAEKKEEGEQGEKKVEEEEAKEKKEEESEKKE